MALKHLSTVLCDYLVTGPDSRNTLIRTYQNIGHVGGFPAVQSPFCVQVELRGEGESFRVVLEGPPGEVLIAEGSAVRPAGLPELQQWATTVAVEIAPMVFVEPGVYAIAVYSDQAEIHRREFAVVPATEEEGIHG